MLHLSKGMPSSCVGVQSHVICSDRLQEGGDSTGTVKRAANNVLHGIAICLHADGTALNAYTHTHKIATLTSLCHFQ